MKFGMYNDNNKMKRESTEELVSEYQGGSKTLTKNGAIHELVGSKIPVYNPNDFDSISQDRIKKYSKSQNNFFESNPQYWEKSKKFPVVEKVKEFKPKLEGMLIESELIKVEIWNFKIKKKPIFEIEEKFKILKVKNMKNGKFYSLKIYPCDFIKKDKNFEILRNEIFLHKKLKKKGSNFVVEIEGYFLTEENLYLVFENFDEVLDLKKFNKNNIHETKLLIAQATLGMLEIENFDFILTNFTEKNLVKIFSEKKNSKKKIEIKIHNLFGLSKLGETPRVKNSNSYTPPELEEGEILPTSSSWILATFILKVYTGRFWNFKDETKKLKNLEFAVRTYRIPGPISNIIASCFESNWGLRIFLADVIKDNFFKIEIQKNDFLKKKLKNFLDDELNLSKSILKVTQEDFIDANLQNGEGKGESLKENKLSASHKYNFAVEKRREKLSRSRGRGGRESYKEENYDSMRKRFREKQGVKSKEVKRKKKGFFAGLLGFLGCAAADDEV